MTKNQLPWAFLDDWRGKTFTGQWPTLPEMFRITAERYPDRPCFTDFVPDRVTRTYAEVLQNIERLANWLSVAGIAKGSHVAVSGKNSSEWATVYLATLFVGGIIIPIDYGLREPEIENLLNTAKPLFFFVDEEKYDYFCTHPCGAQVFSLSPKHSDTYVYSLETSARTTITPATELDTAAILFTSGTTGIPKGVMLSHRNLVSDCYLAQTNLELFPTDVFYALLPIHHSYTMQAAFIEPLSVGAEVVFGKTMAVTRMLKELKEGKITILLGVPLLFNKLLAGILKGIKDKGPAVNGIMHFLMGVSYLVKKLFKVNPGKRLFKAVLEKASISTLRIAICGGGPLAASVFKVYNQLGIDFIQGYGLTETSPIIALNPVDRFKIESVGQFFAPHMEMKILEPDAQGIGEVAVRGPMVMEGYYKMPDETAEVFTEDGFFRTGDLGRLDSEGYLYLAGRAKNMIVTEGGKNVYPEEIENQFQLVTDIAQITVQGYLMDKATKAEGIEALIYPSDELFNRLNLLRGDLESADLVKETVEGLVAEVNRRLQPYSRISRTTILEEPLEMTTTKKVKRTYSKK